MVLGAGWGRATGPTLALWLSQVLWSAPRVDDADRVTRRRRGRLDDHVLSSGKTQAHCLTYGDTPGESCGRSGCRCSADATDPGGQPGMPALASLAEFRQAVSDFPVEELEVDAEPARKLRRSSLWRNPGSCCSARFTESGRTR